MKTVVIGGTRKSGTTLFHSLFDGHKDIIVPPHDLNVFYGFYPRWSKTNISNKEKKKRLYKVTVAAWLEKYKKYQSRADFFITKKKLISYYNKNFDRYNLNNINHIFDFVKKLALSPYNTKNKKILILKETSFEFHLLKINRKIYFIKLNRDPRDILSALIPGLKNKYKFIGEDYYDLIFTTFIRYSLSIKACDILKNKKKIKIKEIKFEELVLKTKKTLKDISKFVGFEYSDILLNPTMLKKKFKGNNLEKQKFNKISKKNIGKWHKRLDQKSINYIEILLKNEILRDNYKLDTKKNNLSLGDIYSEFNDKYFFKDRFSKLNI
jgi:hypothetical protein